MTLIPDLKHERWGKTFGTFSGIDFGILAPTALPPIHETRPQIDIIGTSVALGPLDLEHMADFERWMDISATEMVTATSMTAQFWGDDEPPELDDDMPTVDDLYFTIYEVGSWRAIGGASLTDIDPGEQFAEFSLVIGEPDCRGKGYGTEATRLTLDYAFKALGLKNVIVRVLEFDFGARQAFQKAGFREFTRQKACHLEGSRLWDEIYMGCMSSDFGSQMIGDLFVPNQLRA